MKRILLSIVILAALIWIGDWASFRFRIPGNREVFGTVMVETTYALHKRRDKAEYIVGDPEPVTCSRSLFPHGGYSTCWWVRRHAQRTEDMY